MDAITPLIFLNIADFFPKYCISKPIDINPTAIKLDMNAAICGYPAPCDNKLAPRGNATKLGIKVNEPTVRANITPNIPDFSPRIKLIVSGLKVANMIPMKSIKGISDGISFEKDLNPIFIAFFVFCISKIAEIIRNIKTIPYKI